MQTEASKLEAAVLRALLFAAFKAEGIEAYTLAFDGGGDSGQLEHVGFIETAADAPAPSKRLDAREFCTRHGLPAGDYQMSAIEALCWAALEAHHGGWENDAGAYGSFHFDTESQTIRYEHWERYVSETLHEYDI
jgi:hypothetical protein